MWLSVRMSVVISMSMSQSSSFEESLPSKVGISCSMVMMRFASLYVACKVYIHACIVLCTGPLLGLGAGCGCSIIVRCCSLYVSHISFAISVGGLVQDFKLANWSLSCIARIVLVVQPRDGKYQFLHSIHWMIHCLLLACCIPVAQDPGELSLGWQGCHSCHDFQILS